MRSEAEASDGQPNTWLELSGGLGRFGAALLIVQHLLLLLAPLFFLANLKSQLPRGRTTLEEVVALLSAPEQLVSIADLLAIPGIIFLSVALLLAVWGLRSEKAPVSPLIMAFGVAAFLVLILWVPTTLYSQGRASGVILTLDAVAATGGYTVATLAVLIASLLWMAFTLGVKKDLHLPGITSYHWPVYAAVSLLGAVAIAVFFQSLAAGGPSQDVLLIGVILKATLIPVLGVLAYANLREKFYTIKRLKFAPREAPRPIPPPSKTPAAPPPPPPEPTPAASSPPVDAAKTAPRPGRTTAATPRR